MTFPLTTGSPFSDLEDAISYWVRQTTGLDDAHVLFAEQTGPRPLDGQAFASIRMGGITPLAVVDPVEETYDNTQPPGQEVEQRVAGLREMAVSVQLFGSQNTKVTGDNTASTMALAAQVGLGLPSVKANFEAVGMSLFDNGSIDNVTALKGTQFEGRSILNVRCYINQTVSEHTGYIETVNLEDDITTPHHTFDVSA